MAISDDTLAEIATQQGESEDESVWGVAHGSQVCAFDWYEGSARRIRARLEAEPEYIEKARVFESLVAANPVTASFDGRYGDYWSGEMGYRYYNGPEYNRYAEEWFRLSLAVYGDSPINLHYELRNRRMMDLAWDVIRQHPASRIALLTGSEHKHYFDRDLAAREHVTVVELESLLPLEEDSLRAAVRAFLLEEKDLPYYESGYPRDTSLYYRNKMTELVHGPDMDWRPDIIPARNIEVAGKVLERWHASQPASYQMTFDEAWLEFLNDDCQAAVEGLTRLAEEVERGAIDDLFVAVYTYRNLGLCYDLLGERRNALRSYARVRALRRGTRMEKNMDFTLRGYETVPYRRGTTARSSQLGPSGDRTPTP